MSILYLKRVYESGVTQDLLEFSFFCSPEDISFKTRLVTPSMCLLGELEKIVDENPHLKKRSIKMLTDRLGSEE